MAEGGNPSLDMTVSGPVARVALAGDWTIDRGRVLSDVLNGALTDAAGGQVRHAIIDFGGTGTLDTSGSYLIQKFIRGLDDLGVSHEIVNRRSQQARLMKRVRKVPDEHDEAAPPVPTVTDFLAEVGEAVVHSSADVGDAMTVFGRIMAGLGKSFRAPEHIRFASVVHHIEYAGLNAVPIISLMSFLIGAIIAQQGAFQLRTFGAELFTVDLVGILVLREIGVLLTAIMVAGRSGSAFTAEIGSMKMREEVDALKIIGLDPIEVLALPRVMALMISLPLLTFVANMTAILGAMIVSMVYSGIEPSIFVARLRDAADFSTVAVGFIKAPFMALVIGLVACVEGFRVEGSAESLGRQTTASVVKSIFMVIVMDGIFAIYFAAIDF